MSTTITTVTVTVENAEALAQQINESAAVGRIATLNGEVIAPFEAKAFKTGTVRFRVFDANHEGSAVRHIKVGETLAVETIDAVAHPDDEPKPERTPIVASLKGETGYLSARVVDGRYAYAVTMDEKRASRFRAGSSRERHIARATAAGIGIAA